MQTLASYSALYQLGKTNVSDRHQIRVRVRVRISSRVRVVVRFGISLSTDCVVSVEGWLPSVGHPVGELALP